MERERNVAIVILCTTTFAAVVLAFYFSALADARERFIEPVASLRINGVPVQIAEADTPQERDQGLSGTTRLNEGTGMLFIFEKDGQYSFWMKDMQYSIDIIWISAGRRVVHVEKAVSPETFPSAFTPPTPARYVLEVPAGFSEAHSIEMGSEVAL